MADDKDMTARTGKIGEEVSHYQAPDRAMARTRGGEVLLRLGDEGERVCIDGTWMRMPAGVRRVPWALLYDGPVTIIALDCDEQASADELRRLAVDHLSEEQHG